MATSLITGLLGAGSSLLGGIFGNKPQKTTFDSTETQNGSTTQNMSGGTDYNYDPASWDARQQMLQYFLGRVQGAPMDVSNIIAGQMSNNNNASKLRTQALLNLLAQRGLLRSSSAANGLINEEGFRIGQNVQTQNQAPLLQEQFQQQRANDFTNFFKSLPVGTRTFGNQTGTSTMTDTKSGSQTGPGNMLGGGFSSLGSSLAYLAGSGAFKK